MLFLWFSFMNWFYDLFNSLCICNIKWNFRDQHRINIGYCWYFHIHKYDEARTRVYFSCFSLLVYADKFFYFNSFSEFFYYCYVLNTIFINMHINLYSWRDSFVFMDSRDSMEASDFMDSMEWSDSRDIIKTMGAMQ